MDYPKHIGIVGVTAEGTSLCYTSIVAESGTLLGKNQHPEITINNQAFAAILEAQNAGKWDVVTEIILFSLQRLAGAGADFAIIPANSIHFAIDTIKAKSPLHIIDLLEETANECEAREYKQVGILGVGMTMSNGLFNTVLNKVGVEPVTPTIEDQEIINGIIYNELVQGILNEDSVQKLLEIITKLQEKGCEAVILGCTELPLVITEQNSPLPIIDTTRLLAHKALAYSLAQ